MNTYRLVFAAAIIAFGFVQAAISQTNDFNYQGNLNISGQPANGSYDFEFRLFTAESGGSQISVTATRAAVTVTNGVFNVVLAFPLLGSASAFPGADRWLEIAVRQNGSGGGFQQLLPRTKINSTPYAITAANAANAANASNAANLGGIAASQYVQTTDPRLSDQRSPLPNSENYIRNSNTETQTGSFKISGPGTASEFDSNASRYRFNGTTGLQIIGPSSSTIRLGLSSAECISCPGNTYIGAETGSGVEYNTFLGYRSGRFSLNGTNNTFVGARASGQDSLSFATAIGADAVVATSNTIALGRPGGEDNVRIPGKLALITLGSAGPQSICRNLAGELSTCSSSARYKTNLMDFRPGLEIVRRLNPVSFNWKDGGMADLGLVAEDVAAIEALLVTHNDKGEVEGVKYDRIGVVLVNAIKEQQAQIDSQKAEILMLKERLAEMDEIKKVVCQSSPTATFCKENQ